MGKRILKNDEQPGHYTEAGTKKHQANGPVAWSKVFQRVAGKEGREGEGVRAALAYAVAHADAFVGWAEKHPDAWAPASTAPRGAHSTQRAVKAAKRVAVKAAKRAAVKAPTKRARKAKPAKAPELSMPEASK